MSVVAAGAGSYQEKTVIDQAQDYTAAAEANPVFYQVPDIAFHFFSCVTQEMASHLIAMGISVQGDIIPTPPDEVSDDFPKTAAKDVAYNNFGSNELSTEAKTVSVENCKVSCEHSESASHHCPTVRPLCLCRNTALNLDITALVAYTSALTNGRCGFTFKETILTEQANREQEHPVLPDLQTHMEGISG